jgi:hypothetical protein
MAFDTLVILWTWALHWLKFRDGLLDLRRLLHGRICWIPHFHHLVGMIPVPCWDISILPSGTVYRTYDTMK